jgi:hypothetical protein
MAAAQTGHVVRKGSGLDPHGGFVHLDGVAGAVGDDYW